MAKFENLFDGIDGTMFTLPFAIAFQRETQALNKKSCNHNAAVLEGHCASFGEVRWFKIFCILSMSSWGSHIFIGFDRIWAALHWMEQLQVVQQQVMQRPSGQPETALEQVMQKLLGQLE
mmetsp:Transcript_9551/g.17993  ORF Transcript_9551/g.17993 Transcript_9551/m.17993 type:complete len:120 (+) Transcript_9551:1577-1936(+)